MARVTQNRRKISARQARRHTVAVSLQAFDLTREGTALTITVRDRGEKLGELNIGRGSVVWWGAKAKVGKTMGWSQFARTMDEV